MSKLYRFDFDKGVPISGGPSMKWRKGLKIVSAYSLQGAIEKLAFPVLRQFGLKAKLNAVKAWSSTDKANWTELSVESVMIAGFIAGCLERERLKLSSCNES